MVFMSRWLASFPLSMTVEPSEGLLSPVIKPMVPYEQLYINQQRVAWFMDGGSEEKGQHSVWKASTLTPEGNSESYQ